MLPPPVLPPSEIVVRGLAAAVVVGGSVVAGYRAHMLIDEHAPGIAAWLPRDAGAWAGLIFGIVSSWRALA